MTVKETGGKTPEEILEFLRSRGGHSLLIKGRAGTGKTTFALQIIEELSDEQHDYYLSSRVSDVSLYRQFPWLEKKAKKQEILKAGKTFLTKSRGEARDKEGEVVDAARDLIDAFQGARGENMIERSELHRLEGQIEAGEISDDGEGESPVELGRDSLTLDLGVLLPELELAYDLVESNLPDRSLVVIDSIEAFSEKYGISSQRIVNTLQKDMIESSSTKVVYVMEDWQDTDLDYMGDGVIVLKDRENGGRRIRKMVIEKLRGSRIERWKYMFTLHGGRLTVFEPTPNRVLGDLEEHAPVEDPSSRKVSTGNPHMDNIFGGFPRGSLILFEVGDNVPHEVLRRLEFSIVSDFLCKERGVVWFPLHSIDYAMLNDNLGALMGDGDPFENLRVMDRDSQWESAYPFVTLIEGESAMNDFRWSSLKYMLSGAQSPYVSLLGYDALESVYGTRVLQDLSTHLDVMRRSGNISIAEATSSSASLGSLANASDIHIKLASLSGAVMICGEKPHTMFYYLDFKGKGDPELVPML